MRRLVVLLVMALACVQLAWAQDPVEKRIALVIGNSQYQSDRIPDLANPVNDAEDVARALRGFGFEVTLHLDMDRAGMAAAMETFGEDAHAADVALFYYAGHGMQVELRNYLSPVDAVYTSHEDVINNSVPLDALTTSTSDIEGALLIFIDACQENPTGGADGLARIPVSRNQFVALAALPDNLAADGAGRNSPFSGAFLANAGVPGRNISDVMLAVRQDVIAATGSQVPWDNSSLTREIVLVPGEQSALTPETQMWRLASSLNDPSLVRTYLDRFPDGVHVAEADQLLAALSVGLPVRDAVDVRSLEVEDNLWQLASTSRWRPLLESYLERYPNGNHAEEARELVDILADPTDASQSAAFDCERLTTHPNDATPAFGGVPSGRLQANAAEAIASCREAHEDFPDLHKYTAMLGRALVLGNRPEEGLELFRQAADAGNVRALTTLGALYETGGAGLQQDSARAIGYYEQAAAAGAADAAVNLARMLMSQASPDVDRAIQLLTTASEAGSRQAAFNLGVLAVNGIGLPVEDAQLYFALASDRGYAEGHFNAALFFETDRFGQRDPARAAEYLLRAIAADSGKALTALEGGDVLFGSDTIGLVQERLQNLRLFAGRIDGQLGPQTFRALQAYRSGGLGAVASLD
ncbi:caspase family protein [Devosia sp. Root635]|uniref:caspase family protein n=1 Tax=Devosia sp. Root635 TaxID=1736575 RepID=UPI00138F04B0|nr:caspase family protein [Devosia sp. Root635]